MCRPSDSGTNCCPLAHSTVLFNGTDNAFAKSPIRHPRHATSRRSPRPRSDTAQRNRGSAEDSRQFPDDHPVGAWPFGHSVMAARTGWRILACHFPGPDHVRRSGTLDARVARTGALCKPQCSREVFKLSARGRLPAACVDVAGSRPNGGATRRHYPIGSPASGAFVRKLMVSAFRCPKTQRPVASLLSTNLVDIRSCQSNR